MLWPHRIPHGYSSFRRTPWPTSYPNPVRWHWVFVRHVPRRLCLWRWGDRATRGISWVRYSPAEPRSSCPGAASPRGRRWIHAPHLAKLPHRIRAPARWGGNWISGKSLILLDLHCGIQWHNDSDGVTVTDSLTFPPAELSTHPARHFGPPYSRHSFGDVGSDFSSNIFPKASSLASLLVPN